MGVWVPLAGITRLGVRGPTLCNLQSDDQRPITNNRRLHDQLLARVSPPSWPTMAYSRFAAPLIRFPEGVNLMGIHRFSTTNNCYPLMDAGRTVFPADWRPGVAPGPAGWVRPVPWGTDRIALWARPTGRCKRHSLRRTLAQNDHTCSPRFRTGTGEVLGSLCGFGLSESFNARRAMTRAAAPWEERPYLRANLFRPITEV